MEVKPLQCVWMQAGVVKKKICTTHFDCEACRFDKSMQKLAGDNKRLRGSAERRKGKRGEIVFWKDKLNELPPRERLCLHHMKGRINYKNCTNEYLCGSCEFDQYFNDQHKVHAVVKPVAVSDVAGFKIPQGYYTHFGHAWVKIEEGNEVRIGLDDFALRMLGPLDKISAPLLGKKVVQGQEDISLQRGKYTATVLSPVSGVVTGVNSGLIENGNKSKLDPYAEGWVITAHNADLRRDLRNLMIGDEAENFLKNEVDNLYRVIEDEAPLAADGGLLGDDIFGNLPEKSWKRLTKTFLHTQ